jgi:hypothetical protein
MSSVEPPEAEGGDRLRLGADSAPAATLSGSQETRPTMIRRLLIEGIWRSHDLSFLREFVSNRPCRATAEAMV